MWLSYQRERKLLLLFSHRGGGTSGSWVYPGKNKAVLSQLAKKKYLQATTFLDKDTALSLVRYSFSITKKGREEYFEQRGNAMIYEPSFGLPASKCTLLHIPELLYSKNTTLPICKGTSVLCITE